MSRWCLRSLVLALTLGGASPSRADDTHYQDFLVGGRSIGLGGAFTSIADDPSGLYYNPAGLGDARNTNLQVSTSLYGFERGSIGGELTLPVPGVEQRDIQFTDLIIIPASAGFVQTFGPLDEQKRPIQAYGLSVLVPSFRSFKASAADNSELTDYEGSYQRRVTDRELWSGIGYGRRFGERLRLGLSAYYILRSVVDTENVTMRERLPSGGDRFQAVTNDISLITGNVVVIAGAKLQLNDLVGLGLSVQSPSWLAHSQATLRFSRAVSDPTATPGPQSSLDSLDPSHVDCETRYGTVVRLGANASRKYKYTVSADLTYHAPVDYTLVAVDDSYRDRLPFTPEISRRGVLNFNAGAEFLIVREVSVAGGFFTDFSSAPDIPRTPTRDQPAHVDLRGLSVALGYFGSHTLSRLGLVYSFGSGYDVIPERGDISRVLDSDQAFQRVSYYQSFFYIFLSSTFRY